MVIGIICASERELAPFLSESKDWMSTSYASLTFYEGELQKHHMVMTFSGVGKVNAVIATQVMIDHFPMDFIINAGTCGGIADHIQVMDTVITTECAYHDVASTILTEYHPYVPSEFFQSDSKVIQAAKQALRKEANVFFGRSVTGEQFIEYEYRDQMMERYAPLSVDMETTAIAHCAYVNQIPFIAIRTVTDCVGKIGKKAFHAHCDSASMRAKEFTVNILNQI